ncbi:MAG: flagellar hook protein FlgE [Defluviitaleaceae bacterium]|nr:flagellar hook protein FlgE [Defluviitaleaceae bacterium]
MMRSMFSGVSGLRTHQSRMDVIAHNIANVNTTGFKASRMTFAEAFSQTLSGASGPNPDAGRGGTNPMQVGLGVNVSSISRMMSTGAAQRTDDPLHLMIENDGFFIVGDNTGTFFTRAGDFVRDEEWNIGLPNGLLLQGWPTTWDNQAGGPARHATGPMAGEIIGPARGPVQGITIGPEMRNVPPRATGNVRVIDNIRSSDINTGEPIPAAIDFQDSLGTNYRKDIEFRWNSTTDSWDVFRRNHMICTRTNTVFNVASVAPPAAATVVPVGGGVTQDDGWTLLTSFEFNESGNPYVGAPAIPPALPTLPQHLRQGFVSYLQLVPGAGMNPALYFGQPQNSTGAAVAPPGNFIRIDFTRMTQVDMPTNVSSNNMDGLDAGRLIGLSIGQDGIISGTFSNGQRFELWQIAIALFDNPAGLAALGGNLFAMTANSGSFDGIGLTPGQAGTGLLGGTLEMSNVDLAAEFTEMITTQRGFQANSRVISTSDEMLQELVNLRR